ncbi:MAG TPA: zinc-dependent metalloprotease family protein [Pyrinomonadaceae bacterium]|nr:zinc-dependent metalloprotease family protein [Pyrinomonadaceae bacterium]
MRRTRPVFAVACALVAACALAAWSPQGRPSLAAASQEKQSDEKSEDGLWQEFTARAELAPDVENYRALELDVNALRRKLEPLGTGARSAAPKGRDAGVVITLPLPAGASDKPFARFRVEESEVLAPELAAANPSVKTYRGWGVDDPSATVGFTVSAAGLRGMIISERGTYFIDPKLERDAGGRKNVHLSYAKRDLRKERGDFKCVVEGKDKRSAPRAASSATRAPVQIRRPRRTYRLAVTATSGYTRLVDDAQASTGDAREDAYRSVVDTILRVNTIFEREFAVTLQLVGRERELIFVKEDEDPFKDIEPDDVEIIDLNQEVVSARLGADAYDVGHVFTTAPSGVAYLRSVCNEELKAGGMTGRADASGNAHSVEVYAVDWVAHELGHQFGANHTFASCGGGTDGRPFEPGSGTTIMGYAGICEPNENVAMHSDDYFHTASLLEVNEHIGGESACAAEAATPANSPPIVNGGRDYTIPKGTPFQLTATGSDPDGDRLTYGWEQYDEGNPMFRSYKPGLSPVRLFPSAENLLAPRPQFETLPTRAQTMSFVVTARDLRGGLATDDVRVRVANAGPFLVRPAVGAWRKGTPQTVRWNVAQTSFAPVACKFVRISLSLDGGKTYPVVLSERTPNDGAQLVRVPATAATPSARIKVEAVGNIFFAVSNANFRIT